MFFRISRLVLNLRIFQQIKQDFEKIKLGQLRLKLLKKLKIFIDLLIKKECENRVNYNFLIYIPTFLA